MQFPFQSAVRAEIEMECRAPSALLSKAALKTSTISLRRQFKARLFAVESLNGLALALGSVEVIDDFRYGQACVFAVTLSPTCARHDGAHRRVEEGVNYGKFMLVNRFSYEPSREEHDGRNKFLRTLGSCDPRCEFAGA